MDLGVSNGPAISILSATVRSGSLDSIEFAAGSLVLVQRKRGWLMLHTRRNRPGAARLRLHRGPARPGNRHGGLVLSSFMSSRNSNVFVRGSRR